MRIKPIVHDFDGIAGEEIFLKDFINEWLKVGQWELALCEEFKSVGESSLEVIFGNVDGLRLKVDSEKAVQSAESGFFVEAVNVVKHFPDKFGARELPVPGSRVEDSFIDVLQQRAELVLKNHLEDDAGRSEDFAKSFDVVLRNFSKRHQE